MGRGIRPEEISVVIQGPIDKEFTAQACASVRKYLPGAEIILSTWEGSKLEGVDYDTCIMSKDPGNFYLLFDREIDGKDRCFMSLNRQIISSREGIRKASRKYVCKLRSDSILQGTGFVKEFQKYDNPISQPYCKLLSHRVVTLTTVNPRRYMPFCFYLCEWFFFGLKEDVLAIWDIPLVEEHELKGPTRNGMHFMRDNFGNEQYMWMRFLSKAVKLDMKNGMECSERLIAQSEQSYANCCIFVSPKRAGVYNLKWKRTGYGAASWNSHGGLYTMADWKRMYNRYCGGKLIAIKDPFEELAYRAVRLIRKQGEEAKLYRMARMAYRRIIGK